MKNMLKRIWEEFLDALFPRSCAGCSKAGEDFCATCRENAASAEKLPLSNTFSVWSYQDRTVRRAILLFKYHRTKRLASVFAAALYDKLLEELSEQELFHAGLSTKENILLIPIPMSKKRLRERGYNQSVLIAQALCTIDAAFFLLAEHALLKCRETPRQTSFKNRESRLRNLSGSFAVNDVDAVRGKIVLIIDDVTTTGATLSECQNVLLAAGAKRVYCATVAH